MDEVTPRESFQPYNSCKLKGNVKYLKGGGEDPQTDLAASRKRKNVVLFSTPSPSSPPCPPTAVYLEFWSLLENNRHFAKVAYVFEQYFPHEIQERDHCEEKSYAAFKRFSLKGTGGCFATYCFPGGGFSLLGGHFVVIHPAPSAGLGASPVSSHPVLPTPPPTGITTPLLQKQKSRLRS